MLIEIGAALLAGIAILLIGALIVVPLAILRGWVFSVLWGWFIVPIFGLPALGIATAIGVMFTVTYLVSGSKANEIAEARKKEDPEWKTKLFNLFLEPLVVLGLGWVIWRFFI